LIIDKEFITESGEKGNSISDCGMEIEKLKTFLTTERAGKGPEKRF